MMPVECDVRLFEELDRLLDSVEKLVPQAVVDELQDLSEGNGEEAKAASVGLELADRCDMRTTHAAYADDAVVDLAESDDVTHAVTNDGPLQERLRGTDVSVIGLRGKNKLAIIHH
jgi:rRNA-processing protein FCF1